MRDIIYHGRTHDIFFKGKLYNRLQKLQETSMTQADFESLERKDVGTIYTVTYPNDGDPYIRKFLGSDMIDLIREETLTEEQYAVLNPPDPYTLYTVTTQSDNKIYLGSREII